MEKFVFGFVVAALVAISIFLSTETGAELLAKSSKRPVMDADEVSLTRLLKQPTKRHTRMEAGILELTWQPPGEDQVAVTAITFPEGGQQ